MQNEMGYNKAEEATEISGSHVLVQRAMANVTSAPGNQSTSIRIIFNSGS